MNNVRFATLGILKMILFERNGIPLYIQLKKKLLEDIEKNYKANDLIPPEGKLEKEYQVSRITD